MSSIVNLGNIPISDWIILPGKYSPTSSQTISINGYSIPYQYLLWLNNGITWNIPNPPNGITFVNVINPTQGLPSSLGETPFIFFDVVSTFAIGTFRSPNKAQFQRFGSIEVCQSPLKYLNERNRAKVLTNWTYSCDTGFTPFGIFPDNFSSIDSINSGKPWGVTVCINFNKQTIYPKCGKQFQTCYNGNYYINGYCYNPPGNEQISTYCVPQYDNCFFPWRRYNNVNYWWRQGGKAWCNAQPNTSTFSTGKSANEFVGKNISNFLDDAQLMNKNAIGLKNKALKMQQDVQRHRGDMEAKVLELKESRSLLDDNEKIINKKMEILESRNRQLQVSIDKNIYSKKVLYVLLAVLIAVVIIVLFGVSFLKNFKS